MVKVCLNHLVADHSSYQDVVPVAKRNRLQMLVFAATNARTNSQSPQTNRWKHHCNILQHVFLNKP